MTTEESLNLFNSTYVLAIKVAKEAGTSTTLLYSCLHASGVKPISGLKIDGGKQYLYRRADLEGLNLASLVLKEKLKRDPRGKLHITIGSQQACAFLGINNIKLIELVNTSQLRPHMEISDKKEELHEYVFLRTEVESYRDKNINFSELVSSQEAAEMLSESYVSFYHKWVRTKRLKPLNLKHIHYKHYFLRREIEDLVISQKKTIRSREVAMILKVNNDTLFKWRVTGKLQPISGPQIDGFGYNIYLREDIEKLRVERNKKSNKTLRKAIRPAIQYTA